MNSNVINLTYDLTYDLKYDLKYDLTNAALLPVYEVLEIPVERRLRSGRHLVEQNGIQVEFERRKAA